MLAICEKDIAKQFATGSQKRSDHRDFIYCAHPLHAAFVSKSCVDHAHCIAYWIYSLYHSTPLTLDVFQGVQVVLMCRHCWIYSGP